MPQTLQKQMEIAEAIRTLAARMDESEASGRLTKRVGTLDIDALIAEILRKASRSALKAAVDDPKHPGWPAGTPDGKGGQFRPKEIPADSAPPGIDHNQGPPLEEPPKIPVKRPPTAKLVNGILKRVAYWLAAAILAGEPVGDVILAIEAATWLYELRPWIVAFQDQPKTLQELQQNLSSLDGYNIHHIVEQTPARNAGFDDGLVESPENLVRIPTLKHWQINGWYGKHNDKFNGLSPREYLKDKNWSERVRIGKEALVLFGILKP